ncbi:hypothetical protein ACSZN5_21890 [Aeromonas caviae]
MMNPFSWLQMTNMISYQGLVRTFPSGSYFYPVEPEIKNVEKAYMEQFGIVTPENNALSQLCIDLINDVECGDIQLAEAVDTLNKYKSCSYDSTQKDFIDKAIHLLHIAEGFLHG